MNDGDTLDDIFIKLKNLYYEIKTKKMSEKDIDADDSKSYKIKVIFLDDD